VKFTLEKRLGFFSDEVFISFGDGETGKKGSNEGKTQSFDRLEDLSDIRRSLELGT